MQLARVEGSAVSTVKHQSMRGCALLIAQPVLANSSPDGEPLLVLDHLGAGPGDMVFLSNDGAAAREMVGVRSSPVRWFVAGLVDR